MFDHSLAEAAKSGDESSVKLHLSRIPTEQLAEELVLVMEWGVLGNQPRIISLALRLGAEPNRQGPRGHLALCLAAERGLMTIVQLLVEAGADVMRTDKWSKRPLQYAQEYGRKELLALLSAPADQFSSQDLVSLIVHRPKDKVGVVRILRKHIKAEVRTIMSSLDEGWKIPTAFLYRTDHDESVSTVLGILFDLDAAGIEYVPYLGDEELAPDTLRNLLDASMETRADRE